ncbi:MAG: prepilin-type N-terminal cleavage/methylation domain-containing protein [bacterium]
MKRIDKERYNHVFARNRGFTLLELLIAMTIFAIGLLGIVKLQMQSGISNSLARNMSTAVNLSRNKLEEVKKVREYYIPTTGGTEIVGTDLVDPDSGNDLDNWTNPDHTDGALLGEDGTPGGMFTRAWNIVDDMPDANIKTIRVRVSWNEGTITRSVVLETQIARKNLDYYQ